MVKVKQKGNLPANFDELPPEMQRIIEEDIYRRQLSYSHACHPGDPRLTSMDAEGIPLSGNFGKRIKVEECPDEDEKL